MKKLLFISALAIITNLSYSQSARISEHNTVGWFSTTITPAITKKLSGHIEYIWRRDNFVKDWQQSLLRLGFNYKVHPQITIHAGYGWIETFPYGTYTISAVPKRFPEQRIYEQVVLSTSVGKSTLTNRLRLEQRWIGRYASINSEKPDNFVYLNRLRYMPRIDIPVKEKFYAALYDEIFIGFGKNIGENIFDQNRIGVVAGYKASKTLRVEAGYLNQTVQLGREISNQNVFQYNKGLIVNTYFNF